MSSFNSSKSQKRKSQKRKLTRKRSAKFSYLRLLYLLVIPLILASCSQPPTSSSRPQPNSINEIEETYCEDENLNKNQTVPLAEYCPDLKVLNDKIIVSSRFGTPSNVSINIDKSISMDHARTSSVQLEEFYSLIEILKEQGGSLSVTAICEDSNYPSVRASFPQIPEFNLSKIRIQGLPLPPDKQGNPYIRKQKLKEYNQELEKLQPNIERARQEIANYLKELENLPKINDQNGEKIRQDIQPLLERPNDCKATDIQNAVERSNIILQEDHTFQNPPKTYAVFITDGLDTYSPNPVQSEADVVILVNGNSDSVGIFENTKYLRFDAPKPAFDYLINQIKH